MTFVNSDIQRLAKLAHLDFDEAAQTQMCKQLNRLFVLVETMQTIDTSHTEPLSHPAAILAPFATPLRQDVAHDHNWLTASQKSAPLTENGLYLVPKVIE